MAGFGKDVPRFLEKLREFHLRCLWYRLLERLFRWFLFWAGVIFIGAAVWRLYSLPFWPFVFLLFLALVDAGRRVYQSLWSLEDTALWLDRTYRLQDTLATALELYRTASVSEGLRRRIFCEAAERCGGIPSFVFSGPSPVLQVFFVVGIALFLLSGRLSSLSVESSEEVLHPVQMGKVAFWVEDSSSWRGKEFAVGTDRKAGGGAPNPFAVGGGGSPKSMRSSSSGGRRGEKSSAKRAAVGTKDRGSAFRGGAVGTRSSALTRRAWRPRLRFSPKVATGRAKRPGASGRSSRPFSSAAGGQNRPSALAAGAAPGGGGAAVSSRIPVDLPPPLLGKIEEELQRLRIPPKYRSCVVEYFRRYAKILSSSDSE